MTLTNEARKVFSQSTLEDGVLKLPNFQLDRKVYLEVKKQLDLIGGKWVAGKTQGFIFKEEYLPQVETLIGKIVDGAVVNPKKEFQFYETPKELAIRICTLAQLDYMDNVLEPSAGQGALIEAAVDKRGKRPIDYFELNETNLSVIRSKNLPAFFLGTDFLKYAGLGKWDKIIANPPFNKSQGITHIRKMYGLLNPKGILVSICDIGWMQNSDKKSAEFREWLKLNTKENEKDFYGWHVFGNIGDEAEFTHSDGDSRVQLFMLSSKEFKSSGANVRTCIIVIHKN